METARSSKGSRSRPAERVRFRPSSPGNRSDTLVTRSGEISRVEPTSVMHAHGKAVE